MKIKRDKITPYIINAYKEYQSVYIEKDYSSFDEFLFLNFELTFTYTSMFTPSNDIMVEFPSEEHYFLFLMRYS